jgi:hypothetical protein
MTKIGLIDFDVNEELNKKFLTRLKKLDRRTKKILEVNGFDDLEKFRSFFLSKAGNSHIWMVRGIGIKTERTLTDLFHKTFNKNYFYTVESKNFLKDFNRLSGHAKNALAYKGVDLFETFYYVYFIKMQRVSFDDYPIGFVRNELKQFIKLRCDSIRVSSKDFKSYIHS